MPFYYTTIYFYHKYWSSTKLLYLYSYTYINYVSNKLRSRSICRKFGLLNLLLYVCYLLHMLNGFKCHCIASNVVYILNVMSLYNDRLHIKYIYVYVLYYIHFLLPHFYHLAKRVQIIKFRFVLRVLLHLSAIINRVKLDFNQKF